MATNRTALAPAIVLAAAIGAGGCETLLGIQDPVLLEGDAGEQVEADAGGTESDDGGVPGQDAAAPRVIDFDPLAVACASGGAFDVALTRSEPDTPQDRAIVALESDTLWVCRQPFNDTSPQELALGFQDAQDMWVGDLDGNGTDDVAVLGAAGDVVMFRFEADGTSITERAASDLAVGPTPSFIGGAELTEPGLVDLLLVETQISLLVSGVNGYVEQPDAELFDEPVAAVFTAFEDLIDVVYLIDADDVSQVVVMRAGAEAPHYEANPLRYNIAGSLGGLVAVNGGDGLVDSVLVDTTEGIAVLEREADGPGLQEAYYLALDLGPPMAAGDLTGDGLDDVVGVRPSDGQGGLWLGGGEQLDGGELPITEEVYTFAIDDVDGDGLRDIIASGTDGIVVYQQAP